MAYTHYNPAAPDAVTQNGAQFGMVSRHPWKARFEKRYGTEIELLEKLREELA